MNIMDLQHYRYDYNYILDGLRDLVSFMQFKKREKRLWRSDTFTKSATLLKVSLLNGCFHVF